MGPGAPGNHTRETKSGCKRAEPAWAAPPSLGTWVTRGHEKPLREGGKPPHASCACPGGTQVAWPPLPLSGFGFRLFFYPLGSCRNCPQDTWFHGEWLFKKLPHLCRRGPDQGAEPTSGTRARDPEPEGSRQGAWYTVVLSVDLGSGVRAPSPSGREVAAVGGTSPGTAALSSGGFSSCPGALRLADAKRLAAWPAVPSELRS